MNVGSNDRPATDGANIFINCLAKGNRRGGFNFEAGRHVMYNTRAVDNPIGISIGGDADVTDYDTEID